MLVLKNKILSEVRKFRLIELAQLPDHKHNVIPDSVTPSKFLNTTSHLNLHVNRSYPDSQEIQPAYPESISADMNQAENGRAVGTWHPWQLSLLLMKSILVSC